AGAGGCRRGAARRGVVREVARRGRGEPRAAGGRARVARLRGAAVAGEFRVRPPPRSRRRGAGAGAARARDRRAPLREAAHRPVAADHGGHAAAVRGAGRGGARHRRRGPQSVASLRASISIRASSAKPAPQRDGVIHAGSASSRSRKSSTLATPTAFGKNANIGASLGESPTNTQRLRSASRSIAKRSRIISRVVLSLPQSPNQPLTWIELTLAFIPASRISATIRLTDAGGGGATSSRKSNPRS